MKKLSNINEAIKDISRQRHLKKSRAAYNKYGKGKKIRLRFSKSGNEQTEEAYATHYINIEQMKNKSTKA